MLRRICCTRMITMVVILMLLFSCCPISSFAEELYDSGFGYEEQSDGSIMIVGYYSNSDNMVIPSQIQGKAVTAIKPGAFVNNTQIVTAYLPESIISVGHEAFLNCTALRSITFFGGIKTIQYKTFYNCDALIEVTIPEGVEAIGERAFADCSFLKKITLPQSLEIINDQAFQYCLQLNDIVLPNHIEALRGSAFENSGYYNNSANWENGGLYNGQYLLACRTDYEGVCTVKEGTKLLAQGAFANCAKITQINLPATLQYISTGVFNNCSALTSIVIPASVSKIEEGAFHRATALTWIAVEPGNQNYMSVDGVLFSKDKTLLLCFPAAKCGYFYKVPDGVETLSIYAFDNKIGRCLWVPGSVRSADSSFSFRYHIFYEGRAGDLEPGSFNDAMCHYGASLNDITIQSTASCTQNGDYSVFCKHCDDTVLSLKNVRLTHANTNGWTLGKAPTDISFGAHVQKCSDCASTIVSKNIAKLNADDISVIFSDVKYGSWYYNNQSIDYVYNNALFKGIDNTRFAPNMSMDRAMFVTVLGRLSAVVDDRTVTTDFTDVKSGKYYSGYVKWASDNGIVKGVDDHIFAPTTKITREQICAMMVRYCQYIDITLKEMNAPITFTDGDKISGYAKKAVAACQRGGIVNGEKHGSGYRFRPQGSATRAEVATILMNFSKNYL